MGPGFGDLWWALDTGAYLSVWRLFYRTCVSICDGHTLGILN